jgi:hypothetical protein
MHPALLVKGILLFLYVSYAFRAAMADPWPHFQTRYNRRFCLFSCRIAAT